MSAFSFSTLTKAQLRGWLALLLLALAVPTAILFRQAYSQLKWESFHQYRSLAEDLTTRIDGDLTTLVEEAESYSFADYSFFVVEGDTASNFLQRSPLASYPVEDHFPGLVGFFQVDGDGQFTTPLLPQPGTTPESVGIAPAEYAERQDLARSIMNVLRDNKLVQGASGEAAPADSLAWQNPAAAMPHAPATAAEHRAAGGQAAFDALSAGRDARNDLPATAEAPSTAGAAGESVRRAADAKARQVNSLGKVADLNLQTPFERELKQSEDEDRQDTLEKSGRGSRKEQVALPEAAVASDVGAYGLKQQDVRIDTFESEIDPLEFSVLDSGHFVLFRKVWRNRERYIQGLVIEPDSFLAQLIDQRFNSSVVAGMSDLVVAYGDDVIHTDSGHDAGGYSDSVLTSPAPLLYRNRLASPLDGLELIYRIRHLPAGPGASVLGWVTVLLAAVFCGGFFGLYRLGASQIDLARQQQDFVSAVSHELKTPLTSIRMYGEMLKEGWASPEKKQQYYQYIHDESERLTRLIANVLQLARITRNGPTPDLKPVTVGTLMQDVESRIANQVRVGGFELKIERHPDVDAAVVAADADCFMQVVINLVDNAIKFSGKAATKVIEVSSRAGSDGNIAFSVRDFGPGVEKNQMKKIFRLFYRSESELTRETVGTGIGLAIVHQLILAMHGRVDVMNRDPGAEFIVSLPRVSA